MLEMTSFGCNYLELERSGLEGRDSETGDFICWIYLERVFFSSFSYSICFLRSSISGFFSCSFLMFLFSGLIYCFDSLGVLLRSRVFCLSEGLGIFLFDLLIIIQL
jgi:hypothetical protein